ncbi:hypothetical protein N7G274_003377 [Stereocaulon virgatum]|uniref:Uncharacterized protein n=1 Tax=Stereocaulon virgatum TaxID=373712 RepID=A0ABR4ADG1_9LECA
MQSVDWTCRAVGQHRRWQLPRSPIASYCPSESQSHGLAPLRNRISRAFAEVSIGDAYLCTPENYCPNIDFGQNMTWVGWEYPALTRNIGVTRVIRVDPSMNVTSQIWTSRDPPTPNAPRG